MKKKTVIIIAVIIVLGICTAAVFYIFRNNKGYEQSQVKDRIEKLGYSAKDFENSETKWNDIYNTVKNDNDNEQNNIVNCDLNKASEINGFLKGVLGSAYIKFTKAVIELDEPIMPESNQVLDFENVKINNVIPEADFTAVVLIDAKSNVVISALTVEDAPKYGIYVIDSKDIDVVNSSVREADIKGLAVMGDNDNLLIENVKIEGNGDGGAYFGGDLKNGVIENSSFSNNRGSHNHSAGLVLSSLEILDKKTVYNPWKDELLVEKTKAPNHIVFKGNNICGNNSSGLYSEAGYCNYYIENNISDNDKEGMCLDYASFGNYLTLNSFKNDGWRGRQTDQDLKDDFIYEHGRLEDGSSPCKVPGLSLDNAAYNTIDNNEFSGNYGSGFKTVRSAFRNTISNNRILNNNKGQNAEYHFYGVELGFAAQPDEPVKGLDFFPSNENKVLNNYIDGSHYAGIFLAVGCKNNTITGNTILNSLNMAIEDISRAKNTIENNI